MNEITKNTFIELHKIYNLEVLNRIKVAELRILFEKYLKYFLGKEETNEFISLKDLFIEYLEVDNSKKIENVTLYFIKELNKWHHHTTDKLKDDNLKTYFLKFSSIIEKISGLKNSNSIFNESEKISTVENLLSLNPKQIEAVNSKNRITYINAGPGTGKTHLIAGRILKSAQLNSGEKIVGLAFTNISANELRKKIKYLAFGNSLSSLDENISISTIHSFTYNRLKSYYVSSKDESYNYSIIDEEEIKELKIEFENDNDKLNNYLEQNKLLTLDGILILFYRKLCNDEFFVYELRQMIFEFVIDEAQDLDKIQYKIFLKLFANLENLNLFFVGDQRQNIYDFRGGNFNHFKKLFKDIEYKTSYLIKSYRCPQNVLDFVNNFEFNDCENFNLNSSEEKVGGNLELFEYRDEDDEANNICTVIKASKTINLKDIAILSNSSFYFKNIAFYLNQNKIPFKIFGGEVILNINIRFLKHLINSILNKNQYSLKYVLNFWDKNLKIIGKNHNEILANLIFEDLSNNLNLIINFIESNINKDYKAIELLKMFVELCEENKLLNTNIAELYKSFLKEIRNLNFVDLNFLNSILLSNNPKFSKFYARTSDIKCHFPNDNDYLTLSTIHSAKGLEWNNVFVIGLTDGLFPAYRANLNSEIKKFYVACTRTKKNLHFTRPKNYSKTNFRGGPDYFFRDNPKSFFFKYKT